MSGSHQDVVDGGASAAGAVLVTGAAGYLGRLVVRRLAQDGQAGAVIAADLRPVAPEERTAGVTYRELDVRDAAAVDEAIGARPVRVVVHSRRW